jgi:hypothetical protein
VWTYDPGASVSIGDFVCHVVDCAPGRLTVRFPADQDNDYLVRQAHPRKSWLLLERISR